MINFTYVNVEHVVLIHARSSAHNATHRTTESCYRYRRNIAGKAPESPPTAPEMNVSPPLQTTPNDGTKFQPLPQSLFQNTCSELKLYLL